MPSRGKVIRFPGPRPQPTAEPAGSLTEVRRCRDQAEAVVVRALLDSEGIRAVLRGQVVHSVHPFSVGDLGEVTVLVAADDAERARAVLARSPRQR